MIKKKQLIITFLFEPIDAVCQLSHSVRFSLQKECFYQ